MHLRIPAARAPGLARLRARLGSLHWQLHVRLVYRAAATYAVAAAGTLQLADVLSDALHLPGGTVATLAVAFAAGFPVAVVGAWFFEVRRDRAGRAKAVEAAQAAAPAEGAGAAPAAPPGYVNNLHAQPTPFIGRTRELEAVEQALARPGCRLVSVTGPGGVGKTRLALEAAGRALPHFAHGACVVPLAGVRAAELIAPAVAAALRLPLTGNDDPRRRVLEYLREKRLLLVMDNFEHLAGAAPLVGQVLQAAPGVRVLVTSRERLGLGAEQLVPLQGMEAGAGDEEDGDAVLLFMEGARRVLPGFDPDSAERAAIRRICALVDGLPLAIDLASPWVRLLRCHEIEAEIAASRDFLAASDPALPERHRSLRGAFEWSWRHLDTAERQALGRLAVFRGGFDRAAASQVAGADLRMLGTLADKSLVRVAAPGRYEMLDLLRGYAEAELRRDPAGFGEARRLHANEYATRMRRVVAEPRETPGAHALRDRVGDELGNVRRAARWAASHAEWGELEPLLMGAFAFWEAQGRALEGERSFAAAVEGIGVVLAGGTPDAAAGERLLGVAMLRHGVFLAQLGRLQQAVERLRGGLERVRASGDTGETAFALQHLAGQTLYAGDYDGAVRLQDEALALWEALGDAGGTGRGLTLLGNMAYAQGDVTRAEELYGRAVEILKGPGESGLLFAPLCNLGIIASVRHDYPAARRRLGESLAVARRAENPRLVANALQNLGAAAWEAGDYPAAETHLHEAVRICREMGFRRLLAFGLNALGNVFVARGELAAGEHACLRALAIAAEAGEAPLTLEVLLGLARLRMRQGHHAQAAELAALLQAHPATDQSARTSAASIQAELVEPATDEVRAALARGRVAELDAVVAALLPTSGEGVFAED
ncbi:MAG TPA: tetratricopeptide repeat protein [Longimicrobium sp.]|nr:tetratricopeptide repeat protein [Longimicrobium sp.]